MRLRTAHRNRQRVLARAAHKPVKPPLFSADWREWLDKVLPDLLHQNFINEQSVLARIMEPRQYSTYETIQLPMRQRFEGREISVSGRPLFPVSPNRLQRIWQNIWAGQGGKCADCGEAVPIEKTTKRSHSFKVVCQKCSEKPPLFMVVDDIDEACKN